MSETKLPLIRFQKVGNLRCIFIKCYKNGMIPVINIGPDLSFCACLMLLVGFTLLVLLFICFQILWNIPFLNGGKIDEDKEPNVILFTICIVLITLNLFFMFNAMLGE